MPVDANLEDIEARAVESMTLAAPPEVAESQGVHTERIGSASLLACRALDHGQMNRVIGLGLHAPATEADIDRAIDVFERQGVKNFYLQIVPGAEPAAIASWMSARGLAAHSRSWAKFRRGATEPPPERTDLRIESIGRQHSERFAQVVLNAFAMPAEMRPWLAALPGLPGWTTYLGFDGDRPVAGAALFVHAGVGWLGLGSTLSSHRGHGLQSALLSRRIRDAIRAGCRKITTETGEAVPDQPQTSYGNILRSGFELAYSRVNYTRRA